MSVNINEQETTISFSRMDRSVFVWTSDTTVMTKLDRLCKESPENYQCVSVGTAKLKGDTVDKEYRIADKSLICFRPRKLKRALTEEQKEKLRAQLAAGREKQKRNKA